MDSTHPQKAEVIPQREIMLVSENISRLGDFGKQLSLPVVYDDGLCRVTVDMVYSSNPKLWAPHLLLPTYLQFIGLAIQQICRTHGQCRCWCIGEIKTRDGKTLEASFGSEISVIPTSPDYVLVAYFLQSEQIQPTTQWPVYNGDEGVRVFAFSGDETKLEREIQHLQHLMQERANTAISVWKDLYNRCMQRSELVSLLNQALFIVSPDGPHFQDGAFHSVRLVAPEISATLCAVAESHGFTCSIHAEWQIHKPV